MLQTRMEIFRNAGATPTPKSHTSCDAASESNRDDGKRFVAHADQKLTAFIELESAIRAVVKQKLQRFSQNVWSDVAMELAKHKNGHHPHF